MGESPEKIKYSKICPLHHELLIGYSHQEGSLVCQKCLIENRSSNKNVEKIVDIKDAQEAYEKIIEKTKDQYDEQQKIFQQQYDEYKKINEFNMKQGNHNYNHLLQIFEQMKQRIQYFQKTFMEFYEKLLEKKSQNLQQNSSYFRKIHKKLTLASDELIQNEQENPYTQLKKQTTRFHTFDKIFNIKYDNMIDQKECKIGQLLDKWILYAIKQQVSNDLNEFEVIQESLFQIFQKNNETSEIMKEIQLQEKWYEFDQNFHSQKVETKEKPYTNKAFNFNPFLPNLNHLKNSGFVEDHLKKEMLEKLDSQINNKNEQLQQQQKEIVEKKEIDIKEYFQSNNLEKIQNILQKAKLTKENIEVKNKVDKKRKNQFASLKNSDMKKSGTSSKSNTSKSPIFRKQNSKSPNQKNFLELNKQKIIEQQELNNELKIIEAQKKLQETKEILEQQDKFKQKKNQLYQSIKNKNYDETQQSSQLGGWDLNYFEEASSRVINGNDHLQTFVKNFIEQQIITEDQNVQKKHNLKVITAVNKNNSKSPSTISPNRKSSQVKSPLKINKSNNVSTVSTKSIKSSQSKLNPQQREKSKEKFESQIKDILIDNISMKMSTEQLDFKEIDDKFKRKSQLFFYNDE